MNFGRKPLFVMAGLVSICSSRPRLRLACHSDVDARDKRGHDDFTRSHNVPALIEAATLHGVRCVGRLLLSRDRRSVRLHVRRGRLHVGRDRPCSNIAWLPVGDELFIAGCPGARRNVVGHAAGPARPVIGHISGKRAAGTEHQAKTQDRHRRDDRFRRPERRAERRSFANRSISCTPEHYTRTRHGAFERPFERPRIVRCKAFMAGLCLFGGAPFAVS
jgi:hypothetical protein